VAALSLSVLGCASTNLTKDDPSSGHASGDGDGMQADAGKKPGKGGDGDQTPGDGDGDQPNPGQDGGPVSPGDGDGTSPGDGDSGGGVNGDGDGDAVSQDAGAPPNANWENAGNSACGKVPESGSTALIDNVEDGNDVIAGNDYRHGYWYSDHDAADTTGNVIDPVGVADGANGTAKSIHITGKSTSAAEYAPSIGLSFDAKGDLNCPYDASAYTGVSFYVRATTITTFDLVVPTEATSDKTEGGTCTTDCDGHYFKGSIPVSSSWKKVTVLWSELAQPADWGSQVDFNAKRIAGLSWVTPLNSSFDLLVDEVEFVK